MRVTRITTYPLKSGAGVRTDHAVVTPIGLEHDRRWVALDPEGNRVSARECHALLGVTATPTDDGVRLSDRAGASLEVAAPGPDAPTTPTRMSRVDELVLADGDAHGWLSHRLGRDVRLAYLADLRAREIGASHGGRPGETMSLADAGPILLVTEASVDRLRDLVAEETGVPWLDRDAALERFRPSVVVDGELPFAEDDWQRVRIGEVTYRLGELCDRCVLTTIDLDTLETTHEPIRTLARHRRWDGVTWFGIRLIPELPPGARETLRSGDEVEQLDP